MKDNTKQRAIIVGRLTGIFNDNPVGRVSVRLVDPKEENYRNLRYGERDRRRYSAIKA